MPNIIEEYRNLLDSDASLERLDKTVALIETILCVQWTEQSFPKICRTEWQEEEFALYQQQLDNDFKQYSLFYSIKYPDFPQVKKITPIATTAENLYSQKSRVLKVFLTLVFFPELMERDWFPLKSKYSLFLDACLVLFHHAYFALLPELGSGTPEKKLLLLAFGEFANRVPRDSDKYDLLGLYYEAIEDYEKAVDCYKKVLRLTNSDAHEFMTVLQTCWSFLVEHQRFREALKVLLETYPRVLRRDLEEFNDLIFMTFELHSAHYHFLLKDVDKLESTAM